MALSLRTPTSSQQTSLPLALSTPKTSIDIPTTIFSLEELPKIVVRFFEGIVLDDLNKLANPFGRGFNKTKYFLEHQAAVFSDGLNIAARDVVQIIFTGFTDIYHNLAVAAAVVTQTYNYALHELASTMTVLGYAAATTAAILGDVFSEASVREIDAFASAFGPGASTIAEDFSQLGSTIASGLADQISAVDNFLTHDVASAVENVGQVPVNGIGTGAATIAGGVVDGGDASKSGIQAAGNAIASGFASLGSLF
ncbi:hypothetical protein LTR62_003175 [Meristemomyces frigidus]|uniref:Uncharacterized protein n=1 Tax=Meristemomyces frigidus TaxID=1508187 RepID=A0AAN7YH46_9PEZI|nr:hypothetical protein LTR62_003175 [Meristemomyces frigidus]